MALENLTITTPLKTLIDELMSDLLFRSIDMELARLIFGHLQNKTYVYIQWESFSDPRAETPTSHILERPIMWRFDAWASSNERWDRQRNHAHQERVALWLREANIKRAVPHIMSYLSVEREMATNIAFTLVKNNAAAKLKNMGLDKLLTREDEL